GKWRSSPRLTTAGGQSPLAGAMKRHSALPAGGTSPDAQPKTLATAQPAAGPPRKPSPATSPPTVQVSTGSNWSVVKYALGAAVLIAAIFVGVKVMKQSSEDSDLAENQAKKKAFENRPNTGTTEEPADPEPEPEEPAEAPPVADNDPEPVEDPGPPPEEREPETTLEALERLKSDLAAGKREEFPPATKRRGEDDFLFIETPMSWYQALSFAEAHGGHLALAKSPEELSWISQIVPGETDIWLGAGRAGRNVWTLNDGTDWALDDTPRGVGPFASINQFGTLRAGKVDETKPFVIQWHRDGSNPATIKAILKHTSATLDTPNPIFPPGTESSSARHMAIIPLPMKRSEAEALATLAGGILAVPASANEASWLADELEPYDGSTGFWLGGQREGESWAWDSSETWDHTKWISDEAPAEGGDALVIVPNQGWTSADAAQPASGLIIEWSSDAP
ncbi:MAG: C-type lectin domain-containing protein, partial [Verrucomicrobiota bacterium]